MIRKLAMLFCLVAMPAFCAGQSAVAVQALPDAPEASSAVHSQTQTAAQQSPVIYPSHSNGPAGPTATRVRLTLKEAETLAIKNNPQITAARLQALAAQQVTRETSSGYWPTATANLTAVDSEANSRITAGRSKQPDHLRASGRRRNGQPVDYGFWAHEKPGCQRKPLRQGRSPERFSHAGADTAGHRSSVLWSAQAQAVLRVADETVANRQVVVDQVQALTKSLLKSELDLSLCPGQSCASGVATAGRAKQREGRPGCTRRTPGPRHPVGVRRSRRPATQHSARQS